LEEFPIVTTQVENRTFRYCVRDLVRGVVPPPLRQPIDACGIGAGYAAVFAVLLEENICRRQALRCELWIEICTSARDALNDGILAIDVIPVRSGSDHIVERPGMAERTADKYGI
jgi:hypothetical protein